MDNFILAMYLRISDEDGDIRSAKNKRESNSIAAQRALIEEYIENHSALSTYTAAAFTDDGYSGTNFERPGVEALLAQVKSGRVRCIIVKDFSRFGRSYLDVGNYIEQVFPLLGVRFISINDQFDSAGRCSAGSVDVGFKNLIHDLYSRDLSHKITSIRKLKAQQGKFVTGYAPYGFKKSGDQRLIADKEAADVVRRIFQMALDGASKAEIARKLNWEEIPSPLMLRKQRGTHFPGLSTGKATYWTPPVIYAILNDQRYVGDAVYGKVSPAKVGSRKSIPASREDWIVVADAHQAIVTREQFKRLGETRGRHRYKRSGGKAPLSGKVRCGGCGRAVSRKTYGKETAKSAYYHCQSRYACGDCGCYTGSISEARIEKAVLALLQKMVAAAEAGTWEKRGKQGADAPDTDHKKSRILRQSIKRLESLKFRLYEAYKSEKIGLEEFLSQNEGIERELQSCEAAMKRYATGQASDVESPEGGAKKGPAGRPPLERLTREVADAFIDGVVIEKDGSVKIIWRFCDPLKSMRY